MALPRVIPSRNEVDEEARRGPSPFVGRAEILERLENTRAIASVFIGETGIGKTRLLGEYRARHPEKTTIYVSIPRAAASLPMEPLINLIRLLSREGLLSPGIADSVLRSAERDRVSYVRAAIERAVTKRCLTLQIDDVQWADPATPDALCYCIDRLQDLPIQWQVASQPAATAIAEIEQLRRTGLVDVVHIDGLALDELRELAFKLAPAAQPDAISIRRLHERTAGNPLYAEMLLAPEAPADYVPPSLRLALRRRVEALSQGARRLAGLLAVHQTAIAKSDLSQLCTLSKGQFATALGELAGAELISSTSCGLMLRHELVRDAAYEALSEPTRALHHDRLATYTRDEWKRAGHLVGAGRLVEAARLLLAIGWDRIARESPNEALGAFERAAMLAGVESTEDASSARAGRACALVELGRPEAGFAAFAEFESEAAALAPRLRAFARARFAECARRTGVDASRFMATLKSAVGEATAASPELLPSLLCTLGSVLERANDLHGAEDALRRGLFASDEQTAAYETIRLQSWLGVVTGRLGRVDQGISLVETAANTAASLNLCSELAACCTKLCYLSDMAHDLVRYEHWCRVGLSISEPIGRRSQAMLRMNLAYVETDKGMLQEALGLCLATISTLPANDSIVTQAHCHLAMLHAILGDFTSANRAIELAGSERPSTSWRRAIDFIAGRIAELQGCFERALALYGGAGEADGEVYGLRADVGVVRCAFRMRNLPAADVSIGKIRAKSESDWAIANMLKREAEAYWTLASGDVACGTALLAQVADETPDRFRRAQIRLDVAELTGDRNLFVSLIEEFERLGATWIAERARGLARSHGLRPGRRRSTPSFLTEREAAVVNLVAGGKTNAEIGSELHVSARTVEYHVGNILGKCGLRSRVEIAARVAAGEPLSDGSQT